MKYFDTEAEMKKTVKIILAAVISVVCGILALVLLVWGGLNIAKYVIYSDYYGVKDNVCTNPGLSDGFVCQGICVADGSGKILVSGYMKDDSASRIYVTDKENNSYYVTLKNPDSSDFTGHAGGVATHGDTVYIASGGKVHFVSLTDLMAAENGDAVQINETVKVNNEASFVYAHDKYIYVGEFHDGKNYITEHPYTDPDEGEHFAIVSRYKINDFVPCDDGGENVTPDRIYSIRNKVQGICFAEGKVVMSTSYGITDSVYYVYDESNAVDSGETLDGAPVYFLGECQREMRGPAMAEGLDYYDGKVITLTESASDKYIFGKFFFADKIVSLDVLK